MVFPVILGKGRRLFTDDIPRSPFSLSDLRRLGAAGVTVQAFVPIVS